MTALTAALAVPLATALNRHRAGDTDAAIAGYRAVLAADPREPTALAMLGVIAQQRGNAALALQLTEAALGIQPDLAIAWRNRGLVLRGLRRFDEALASVAQALTLDRAYAGAWSLQGLLQHDLVRPQAALASLRRAVELEPDNAAFLADLAYGLMTVCDFPAAYRTMQQALRHDPQHGVAIMANILQQAGYPALAIPYFRQAYAQLALPDLLTSEALAHLQMGDFDAGWPLWQRRQLAGGVLSAIPDWDGQPVERLLLYEDQGLGDALQGARYIPLMQERVGQVILQPKPALHRLFAASFPGIEVAAADAPTPAADAKARLLSLPALCGMSLTNPPPAAPYLTVDETWRAPWRRRLATMPGPRIGLVWAGNPANHNDHKRSVTLAQLALVLAAGAGHLVSLQLDVAPPPDMIDAAPAMTDFTATAGLLAELDLLIAVDTAAAHLAGALNRPVWLLLSTDPHWPWLMGREDSIWYASMRIFRQKVPRDWPPVIARVAASLRRLLAGDRGVLEPERWQGPLPRQDPYAVFLPELDL